MLLLREIFCELSLAHYSAIAKDTNPDFSIMSAPSYEVSELSAFLYIPLSQSIAYLCITTYGHRHSSAGGEKSDLSVTYQYDATSFSLQLRIQFTSIAVEPPSALLCRNSRIELGGGDGICYLRAQAKVKPQPGI